METSTNVTGSLATTGRPDARPDTSYKIQISKETQTSVTSPLAPPPGRTAPALPYKINKKDK